MGYSYRGTWCYSETWQTNWRVVKGCNGDELIEIVMVFIVVNLVLLNITAYMFDHRNSSP